MEPLARVPLGKTNQRLVMLSLLGLGSLGFCSLRGESKALPLESAAFVKGRAKTLRFLLRTFTFFQDRAAPFPYQEEGSLFIALSVFVYFASLAFKALSSSFSSWGSLSPNLP